MHRNFHHEIKKLQQKLLTMGSMVEDRVRKACKAIETDDIELSTQVIKGDWEIDEMEIELEEECLKIMALYQPVAKDLRFLVTVIKVNNELERIGDYAVQICKRAKRLSSNTGTSFSFDFQGMADKVMVELTTSLDSLVQRDVDVAKQIFILDEQIIRMRKEAYSGIVKEMGENPENSIALLNLYLLVRHLERIAGRATNIAEDVIYMVEGDIVRRKVDFDYL